MEKVNKNFIKLTHKGVSLIILIVTIVVIVILAATVILTLSKNNSIEGTREAKFKEDVRNFQDELALGISKDYAQKAGQRDGKFNAVTVSEIKKYIPSFNDLYDGKFKIIEDELQYLDNKFDDKEIKWLEELSVKKSERAYVKEGLILHYDGIKNTRNGNNPNATTWEDLSGNNNDGKFINLNNTIKYKENGYEFTNNSDYIESLNNLGLSSDPNVTFEFVYKWYGVSGTHNGIFYVGSSSPYSGGALTGLINVNAFDIINKGIKVSQPKINVKNSISYLKRSGVFNNINALICENGITKQSESYGENSMNLQDTSLKIGRGWQWGNNNRTLNGIIYSVRVYNRVLSDDEIKQNYEVDKKRFNIE